MGKIVDFSEERKRREGAATEGRTPAIDEPRARRLRELAGELEKARFESTRDREHLGTNWHSILHKLKSHYGLKSKSVIYEVLQRDETTDDAGKKSSYYEVPTALEGADRDRRVRQITKSGRKWLLLIKAAANFAKVGPYDWLLDLVRGTSLEPKSSQPQDHTPDPIRAVMDLANAACRKIAAETGLHRMFEHWQSGLVGYDGWHHKFLMGSVSGVSDEPDIESSNTTSSQCFDFDGNSDVRPMRYRFEDGLPPICTVPFGIKMLPLRRLKGKAAKITENAGGGYHDTHFADVSVALGFEFRLGIGRDELTTAIVPLLEIRDWVRLQNAETGAPISFSPRRGIFPYIHLYLEDGSSDLEELEETLAGLADDDIAFMGYDVMGYIMDGDSLHWARVTLNSVTKSEWDYARSAVEGMYEVFKKPASVDSDGYDSYDGYLESRYMVLTPQIAERFLSGMPTEISRNLPLQKKHDEIVFEGRRMDLDEIGGLSQPHMFGGNSTIYSALNILEQALLESSTPNSLFHQLQDETRSNVEKFVTEYQKALSVVRERHRMALDFLSPPDESKI